MILTICSVYDRVAETFGRPFYVTSTGSAIRSFTDEINSNSPENMLFKHPKDFELFCLGTFSDATAEFCLHEKPLLLTTGAIVSFSLAPTE